MQGTTEILMSTPTENVAIYVQNSVSNIDGMLKIATANKRFHIAVTILGDSSQGAHSAARDALIGVRNIVTVTYIPKEA